MLRNPNLNGAYNRSMVLNEVLSLNAQECHTQSMTHQFAILNEVLSLNAQEFNKRCLGFVIGGSSMKS